MRFINLFVYILPLLIHYAVLSPFSPFLNVTEVVIIEHDLVVVLWLRTEALKAFKYRFRSSSATYDVNFGRFPNPSESVFSSIKSNSITVLGCSEDKMKYL